MELFKQFISEYGPTILYALVTALAGYLGMVAKNLYTKYVNNKIKKEVVKTVVMAVQQLYSDLSGKEKLIEALESASEMLEQQGIAISDLELRMLIEAAVGEFKGAFTYQPLVTEDN